MREPMTLSMQFPHLAKEFHPTKNEGKTLDQFTQGSSKKVWWQCEKGHEWEAIIKTRTRGSGCPYCLNQKVWVGDNDLATTHPNIATQWHPTKNGDLTPEHVSKGSMKKVWWKCSLGHEWETSPYMRTQKESGCPYCSNQKVWVGFNDLATTDPDLASYWHPTLNHPLTPQDITRGSGKKIWWQCRNGHTWRREPFVQTYDNWTHWLGCPICSDLPELGEAIRSKPKRQTFFETHPELIEEVHPTKNEDLHLPSIGSQSKQKIWWLGTCGHEWESSVSSRTKAKGDCPYCANKKTLTGFNDLATTHPELAKEWHPTKNNGLTPDQIRVGSSKKVWWKGECGHEWEISPYSRAKGSKCPYCSNREVLVGFNDLATTHPELAKEWHPTKNGDLTPKTITSGSNQKVWWKGNCQHEWEAPIYHRANGTGCPYCSNREVLVGFNDLATLYPEIAQQWHPTKNDGLSPNQVVSGSAKTAWWQCEQGHEWKSKVVNRTRVKTGCPICQTKKRS